MNHSHPAVIGLNGPPHSGKTHLVNYLLSVIPNAVAMYPNLELYAMMQADGLVQKAMLYHDYKRLPGSRDALIQASRVYRLRDPHVYERRVVESETYRHASVVIIDNVGHVADEMSYYDEHSVASLLLRIDTPFQELEPLKSRRRRLRTQWEGDSRTPLEHHTMLTAYDSQQMTLLLQWLRTETQPRALGPYASVAKLLKLYYFGDDSCHPSFTGTQGQAS